MSKFIDADALLQKYYDAFADDINIERNSYWDSVIVRKIVNEMSTADVVEVVRCKDCENWDRHWISSTFTENAHRCVVLDNVFDGEFYCACGHRRRSV